MTGGDVPLPKTPFGPEPGKVPVAPSPFGPLPRFPKSTALERLAEQTRIARAYNGGEVWDSVMGNVERFVQDEMDKLS